MVMAEIPRDSRSDGKTVAEDEEADSLILARSLNKEQPDDSIINNDENNIDPLIEALNNNVCNKIMSEYYAGDWKHFFNTWDTLFITEVKETLKYNILTLKLRVHFAILPIRIVQLHQTKSDKFPKVTSILNNVSDKFISVDDEKEIEDDRAKLTIESMKQLEDFLNSSTGQKLTVELKDSSFMTFFALPYIVNPQDDESVKNIFSLDWLDELTTDLENFMKIDLLKKPYSIKQIAQTQDVSSMNSYLFANDNNHQSKLTRNKSEVLLLDKIIQSAIKNKQIEDWITQHENIIQDSDICTKSTQTRISSIKTGAGFSLISEPHHYASVVVPNNYAISSKQSGVHSEELNVTKSRLLNMHKHYKKLKLRFHKLHEDYQKMNEIAEKLTIALESSVKGQPVNLDMILQTCKKIFPDRFNTRYIQTDSEDTFIDSKEETRRNVSAIDERNYINKTSVPPIFLDYKKIKLHLKSADIKTKLLLLQALRQKLTKNQQQHRHETMNEYKSKDLLGIEETSIQFNSKSILSTIMPPFNADVSMTLMLQSTSRFLNAIASLSSGRNYLAQGPIVLNSIIKHLDSCNNGSGDAITLDMLLATLQKMSLRKQQRNYMVKANLVEWLIHHLYNETCKMGSYRLEYTCALLMNLSLQSTARSRASAIAPLLISTMMNLLTFHDAISPYVNGALQNFLLNNEINEEAKKLRLGEILEFHRVKSTDELRNHYAHTLKIHRRECDENLTDDDEFTDEDDEIFDIIESQLEENDLVESEFGEFQGERLLAECYTIPSFHSLSNKIFDQDAAEIHFNDRLSRESKIRGSSASMIIVTSETTFVNSKTEIMERKSGTVTLAKQPRKLMPLSIDSAEAPREEEEDAFVAKPKLMRTPPASARVERTREKLTVKRTQSEVRFGKE